MLNNGLLGKMMQWHIDQGDPETFVVGTLVAFDESWLLMQDVSPLGFWNGLALYLRSDLVCYEDHTLYLSKLQKLLSLRNTRPFPFLLGKGNLLTGVLALSRDTSKALALELHFSGNRDVIGFVDKIENNTIFISQIDEYGMRDGISMVDAGAITRCFVGDIKLENLTLLAQWHTAGIDTRVNTIK